jgi:hypothetical protein
MRSSDGEVVAMENRAIRITIELPEGLGGSMGPAVRVAEATGVTADSGGEEPASRWGSTSPPGVGAGPEPAGAPIDAGAPPPYLIAALGGEAGLSGHGMETEGDGTGSDRVGAEGGAREERAIDAGPVPEHVVSLLETSGPRHPMAESADFRTAFTAEDTFHRN